MKIIKEGDWVKQYNRVGIGRGFYADNGLGYEFYFPMDEERAKLSKEDLKATADKEYETWKAGVLSGDIEVPLKEPRTIVED